MELKVLVGAVEVAAAVPSEQVSFSKSLVLECVSQSQLYAPE